MIAVTLLDHDLENLKIWTLFLKHTHNCSDREQYIFYSDLSITQLNLQWRLHSLILKDDKSACWTVVFTFVRSIPRRTWESRCMMTLLCSSTDSPSGSSSRSSWLSNSSEISTRGASHGWNSIGFRLVCSIFLPASVVPLDMDELRDSVVSGRFKAVSWLLRDEAAEAPVGLKKNMSENAPGSREKAGSQRVEFKFLVLNFICSQ